jgi:hypothetical protein
MTQLTKHDNLQEAYSLLGKENHAIMPNQKKFAMKRTIYLQSLKRK